MQKYLLLFMLVLPLALNAQVNLESSSQRGENPLGDYLDDMNEMGRTLSGWNGESTDTGSWFFGSYAMLVLRNNGHGDNQPFPGLEALVPSLWSDFKYLTPRYLVELAGGALSYGDLMAISQTRPYGSLRTEEKFIIQVAGFRYLRMLQGTIGEPLFGQVITATMAVVSEPEDITTELIRQVGLYQGSELGQQFGRALSSGTWMDVELEKPRKRGDSTEVYIRQKGDWAFPVDILIVSGSGDSTVYFYGLEQDSPLIVDSDDISRIIIDPDHKLAEFYRYNNKWPRIKDNIYLQPFAALPDWESYRITFTPNSWSDWDGNKRYGLKFSAGFGVDLWPAYPSDYRHRISLDINAHTPYDSTTSWGGRFSYGHPLSRQKRLFAQVRLHNYADWSGMSVGLTKYIGKQRFLIQGPKLMYQRLNLALERDHYADSLIWESTRSVRIIKASYTGLSLTRFGDRLYLYLRTALGSGPEGNFSMIKSQIDLSGVFWNWLAGGLQIAAGSQTLTTPGPYQFTQSYAWQDNLAALPRFRGQSEITDQPSNYFGLSVSGGYWVSWFQVKIFGSSMIFD
ncbi:MAG: hypothetical protein L3J79_08335, partial [Candidatus Marinimicrobia bacterium]|nr:hypothetical protein [Candidatus Neomarinimicrobiota bacterium]